MSAVTLAGVTGGIVVTLLDSAPGSTRPVPKGSGMVSSPSRPYFLKGSQAEDVSWGKERAPDHRRRVDGVLSTGNLDLTTPLAKHGLQYIEHHRSSIPAAHHIAGKDAEGPVAKNYVTSVNVMALVAANREDRYKR